MEGVNCLTGEKKTGKPVDENEMQDSGCEQSPSTPSPPQKCQELESQSLVDEIKTYDRDFLLLLQFSPLSLNPDPDQLLWKNYDNSPPSGIFHPSHCFYSKPVDLSQNGRKEMQPEYFKPMLESSTEILRPQRKSFVSGCQMRTSISESNDKPNTPTKPNPPSQRRLSESKDRPRSVPTVERGDRRVGSGRLLLERADSRPDSRGQPRPDSRGATYSARDKPARPSTHADKRDNWRHRGDEEDYPTTSHHKEGSRENARITRDNREQYRNNGYNNRRHHQDAEPEWFTEDISTSDTIELKGFDGHKEKIEKREKHEREKKEKHSEKQQVKKEKNEEISQKTNSSESADVSTDRQVNSEKAFPISLTAAEADLDKSENMFDFDSFMDSMHLPNLHDSGGATADLSSSKFSRLFSKEDRANPIHLSFGSAFGSSIGLPDELHDESHMNSLVKELLSPGGLGDNLDSPRVLSPVRRPSTDGDRLLHMLHSSAAAASTAKGGTVEKKTKNELPAVLSQLLSPPANGVGDVRSKPELPTKYKTLEELEADFTPKTKPVNAHHQSHHHIHREADRAPAHTEHNKQRPHAEHTPPRKPEQEMAAFNKLVGLLKVTGELDKTVPKMPEVTNTETPNQQKKMKPDTSLTSMEIAQVEHGSPILPAAAAARPRPPPTSANTNMAPHSSIPAPVPNSHLVNARNTPPILQPSSLPSIPAMMPNTGLFPSLTSNGGPQGLNNIPQLMQSPAQSINLAAAMHPSAFHGPVNPLIQQTMHQRQKLPSPIMFGAQPPVHIVAPAPIHPMGQFQHILSQTQQQQPGARGGGSMMNNQHMHAPISNQNMHAPISNQNMHAPISNQHIFDQLVASTATAMPKPQPVTQTFSQPQPMTQTVSSMAFTPTSVMRKLASDKVDERRRLGVNDNHVKQMFETLQTSSGQQQQQQQAVNMRAVQQQHQFQSQQQQMNMRPIVKNNGASVAEQLIARHLMEQQNQSTLRQAAAAQQQHGMNMFQQQQHHPPLPQQHQLPPQQSYNAFPQTNNMNNMFPQHQSNLFAQQSQSVNLHQHSNPHHSLGSLQPQTSQHHHLGGPSGLSGPSVSPLPSLHQQLAFIQQAQQQVRRSGSAGGGSGLGKASPDNITRWFCGAEIVNQQNLPLPKHAMLKLEDIEH